MLALGMTGCGSDESTGGDDTAVSGTVTMNGSTSMEELVEATIETLAQSNPDLKLLVSTQDQVQELLLQWKELQTLEMHQET